MEYCSVRFCELTEIWHESDERMTQFGGSLSTRITGTYQK
jgi:hypothetical protein